MRARYFALPWKEKAFPLSAPVLSILVFRIFLRQAPHFLLRIFFRIPGNLVFHCLQEIDTQIVGKFDQVNANIGNLISDLLTMGLHPCVDFPRTFPEKMLEQFPRLQRYGNGHVLGIVKLRPIPGVAECTDLCADVG